MSAENVLDYYTRSTHTVVRSLIYCGTAPDYRRCPRCCPRRRVDDAATTAAALRTAMKTAKTITVDMRHACVWARWTPVVYDAKVICMCSELVHCDGRCRRILCAQLLPWLVRASNFASMYVIVLPDDRLRDYIFAYTLRISWKIAATAWSRIWWLNWILRSTS